MALTDAERIHAVQLAIQRYAIIGSIGGDSAILYNNGDQCTPLTGGWTTPVLGRAWWEAHHIDATFNSDNMELNQTNLVGASDIYNCGVRTANPIDLRTYTWLHLLVYSDITPANSLAIHLNPSTQWDYSVGFSATLSAGMNTISKKINSFTDATGADYLRINLLTDTFDGFKYPPYAKVKIYKVWVDDRQ